MKHDNGFAELALRYFLSHGPARFQDFAWWAGLTLTEAHTGHQTVKEKLAETRVDGDSFWMSPELTESKTNASDVFMLPGFDEYVIGYKDRKIIIDDELDLLLVPYKNGCSKPPLFPMGASSVPGNVISKRTRGRSIFSRSIR